MNEFCRLDNDPQIQIRPEAQSLDSTARHRACDHCSNKSRESCSLSSACGADTLSPTADNIESSILSRWGFGDLWTLHDGIRCDDDALPSSCGRVDSEVVGEVVTDR